MSKNSVKIGKADKEKSKTKKSRSFSENGGSDSSNVKCVLVGDGSCGKSSLVHAYMSNQIPDSYTPTVFDDYVTDVNLGKKKLQLKIRDTAGQEDYDRLRPLSYDDVNIAVVCYDVTNHDSFLNVEVRWFPELEHFCPELPKVLVACKCDLSQQQQQQSISPPSVDGDEDKETEKEEVVSTNNSIGSSHLIVDPEGDESTQVTTEMGAEMRARIGADIFVECSAKTGHNIEDLFQQIVNVAYSRREKTFYERLNLKKKFKCSIM